MHQAIAGGLDKGDAPPLERGNGARQTLERAELKFVVKLLRARVVWLVGEQV
jgi:hypothetical protein